MKGTLKKIHSPGNFPWYRMRGESTYILMTEPAFRCPHWTRICTDEPLGLSKCLWRRQELNTENDTVQNLFFSNNSLLASMASFSSGPCQVKGPQALLF